MTLGGGNQSHEIRKIVSQKAMGNKRGLGNRSRSGQTKSAEEIERNRIANTGRKDKPETIIKKSNSALGKNTGKRRTEECKQFMHNYATTHGFGKWLKGRPSKKKRTRMRVCYCCFKAFDATGVPETTCCSISCAAKINNLLRKTA